MSEFRSAEPGLRTNARLVEHVRIDDLVPYPRHTRTHSKRQIRKLARSIEGFGLAVPVLADQNNVLIAGHAVVEAARYLGMTEVPVLRIDHLDEPKKAALRIALNRLPEDAEWNREALAIEIKTLLDLDFDIELTGFEMPEIDLRLDEHRIQSTDEPELEDESPSADFEVPSVTQPGDHFYLGRHGLICGDARDPGVYSNLMADEKAAAISTDPPYNRKIAGAVGRGSIKHAEFPMASGEMSRPAYTGFLTDGFSQMAAHAAEGALAFVFSDAKHLLEMITAGEAVFGNLLNVLVWDKGSGGMGGIYRNQHEHVLLFRFGDGPAQNNVQLGRHGRSRTTIWRYRGLASFGKDRLEQLSSHPTVKPVAMIADAILDVTRRNDIVLDPFAGSGTTVIAAEKTGRRARVIEIDPHYCDVIVRRWQRYSGKAAIHAETGLTFEEVAERRRASPA